MELKIKSIFFLDFTIIASKSSIQIFSGSITNKRRLIRWQTVNFPITLVSKDLIKVLLLEITRSFLKLLSNYFFSNKKIGSVKVILLRQIQGNHFRCCEFPSPSSYISNGTSTDYFHQFGHNYKFSALLSTVVQESLIIFRDFRYLWLTKLDFF